MGLEGLRSVFSYQPERRTHSPSTGESTGPREAPLSILIDELDRAGRGVIMTMGKGGVGKTTIASAIAIELAHRGRQVHLSTTDPAAEIARYTAEVISRLAPSLDAQGLALLEEDLRSPCTEEIAVFSAFAHAVAAGRDGFVVLDTAPTGHTLLLLDAAESYHRDFVRNASDMPEPVRRLLPNLRDPQLTKVLLVTLPEATPVHEAARLQEDLVRAGITPFAWIVNQSFAGAALSDPVLLERAARELPFIAEVRDRLSTRIALIPWTLEPPVGLGRLLALARGQ